MVTKKSDTVRELILSGNYKKALYVVRGFRLGITKEDSNKLKLAYECMVHPEFYAQLGTNTASAINEGIQILNARFGQTEI